MADGDVETAVVERAVFIRDVERERNSGVVPAKLRQARQEPECREGNGRGEREKSRALQFLKRPFDCRKTLGHPRRETDASVREPEPRSPQKKSRAETLLELRDSLTHGGLREPERFGRGGEASALRAGGKDP